MDPQGETPRIIIQKRTFFTKKRAWIFGVIGVVILLGTMIQMQLTWNRERLRGITSDATDFIDVAKSDISTVLPPKGTFDPFIDLFNSFFQ